MTYHTRLSIINSIMFVLLITALNVFTDLTNNAKIVIGLSLVFLDFAHKFNPRVAIMGMMGGCLSIYIFSDPDFAAAATLTSFFTLPLEMCIFYWWYYVKKRPFALSLLLSNAVPSILDGVVWSFVLGSFTLQWSLMAPYCIIVALIFGAISVCVKTSKIRYRTLALIPIMLGLGVIYFHTDSWIDPAAEAWANWMLGSVYGFFNLIGLTDAGVLPVVSLGNIQDKFYISVVDWIVSACYMLAPVAFFAAIYVRLPKRSE